MEVRLGSSTGRLITTVALPHTGSGWSNYRTVEVELADANAFSGVQDIYLVLKGTTDATYKYIVNLDCVQFIPADSYGRYEAEAYDEWSAGGLKTETSTDSAGVSLVNLGATYNGAWLAYYDRDFGG